MVHLREAATTIRTKINTKINETISNFRDTPSPTAQYQTSCPDETNGSDLSTLHRLVLSRARATATSFSHSTSTPPPSNPPNDNTGHTNHHNSGGEKGERTTKVVLESLYSTMFGVCTGTQHESCSATGPQCPASSMYYCQNYTDHLDPYRRQHSRDVLHTMQKRTRKPPPLPTTVISHSSPPAVREKNHGTRSNSAVRDGSDRRRRQRRQGRATDRSSDEYNYANFYNDDDYHAQQQQRHQQQTPSAPTTSAHHPVPSTQLSVPARRHNVVTPPAPSAAAPGSTSGGGGGSNTKNKIGAGDNRGGSRNHRREPTRRRLNVITPREAEENRIARSNNAAAQVARGGSNRSQGARQEEHIDVGGMSYRLTECGRRVQSSSFGGSRGGLEPEEEDGLSYNYDDGISALSAHTLEDMAKRELFLDRQRGIPVEEGFDIAQGGNDGGGDHHNLQGNPSMISNMEESGISSLDAEIERTDVNSNNNHNTNNHNNDNNINNNNNKTVPATSSHSEDQQEEQISKGDSLGPRRASYPVQMARNRSALSNATGTSSKQSSKSDFSDVWKRQEQQYWMQVVEEDGPVEFAIASEAAKKAAQTTDEKKTKPTKPERSSPQQPQQQQHPHETMRITARDVVPQKKKKKNRSRAIFGRRKGYVTYEEEEDIEHSPVRTTTNGCSISYGEV